MKRMDAGGYAACFNHEQLALMCANSDRTIDRLGAENKQLKTENKELRELVSDMWQLINDLDATPYVTERHGNNPAVTWLDDDWSVHESCRERMRDLGIEVPA